MQISSDLCGSNARCPAMATKGTSPGLYLVSFAALYFAANFGLNLVNKTVLAATGMPLFLTFTHMVFSFFVLLPFMLQPSLRAKHAKTLRVHWKGQMAIGCLMALNVSLSNASLVKLSLSLNQVIRRAQVLMPDGFEHSSSSRARDGTRAVIACALPQGCVPACRVADGRAASLVLSACMHNCAWQVGASCGLCAHAEASYACWRVPRTEMLLQARALYKCGVLS